MLHSCLLAISDHEADMYLDAPRIQPRYPTQQTPCCALSDLDALSQHQMSTLCFEILSVLSTNEHVAETMARDPALRSTLVDEVNRIFGWQWSESAPTDSAPSDSAPSDSGFGSGGVDGSSAGEPPAQRCPGQTRGRTVHAVTERLNSHIQRQYPREPGFALLGGFGTGVGGSDGADGFGRRGGKKELGQFGQRVDSSRDEDLTDGTADQEPGIEGLSGGSGQDSDATADAAAADAADAAGGTISLDPIYAAIALQTLGNVMRARRKATQPPKPVTEAWDDMAIAFFPEGTRLPWPLDLLYGGNDWSGADGSAATAAASPPREAPVEWSLDKKVVGDLAEVMLSINPREIRVDGVGNTCTLLRILYVWCHVHTPCCTCCCHRVIRYQKPELNRVRLMAVKNPRCWQGYSKKGRCSFPTFCGVEVLFA